LGRGASAHAASSQQQVVAGRDVVDLGHRQTLSFARASILRL